MKRLLTIIIISLVANVTFAHDLKIAFFEIKEKDGIISGVLRADRVEMLKALNSDLKLESLNEYIAKHIKVSSIKDVSVRAISYELKDQIMEVKCEIIGLPINPTQIKVWNNILLDQVDGHENVVIFKLNNKTRSFRMSEKRKEIIAKYDNI